uniref:Uncharacterized protein n=1 Tax=Arundo donax TaxID=35708 RepID=A0A0A9BCR4_ARUDO
MKHKFYLAKLRTQGMNTCAAYSICCVSRCVDQHVSKVRTVGEKETASSGTTTTLHKIFSISALAESKL